MLINFWPSWQKFNFLILWILLEHNFHDEINNYNYSILNLDDEHENRREKRKSLWISGCSIWILLTTKYTETLHSDKMLEQKVESGLENSLLRDTREPSYNPLNSDLASLEWYSQHPPFFFCQFWRKCHCAVTGILYRILYTLRGYGGILSLGIIQSCPSYNWSFNQ